MDNAIYVGLSRQMVLQRSLDITANNLANVDTVGFKVEELMTKEDAERPRGLPASQPVKYVIDDGVARNFGQGSLDRTGDPYDIGIQGDAFFTVSTPGGPRYTRNGQFTVDSTGKLVTKAGDAVLGAGGSEITFDPQKSPPAIGRDGVITQTSATGQVTQVGKLEVVRFDRLGELKKAGDNLYTAAPGQSPVPARDAQMVQGSVERSNVQPVAEITRLIDITRAYERVSNMLQSTEDLSSRAVDRLGRAS